VEWGLWDCFDIQGDMTLRQLIEHFEEKHSLKITMLSCGVSLLYSFFMQKKKIEERLGMKILDVVESVSKKPIASYVKAIVLEICVEDRDGEDVEVPYIRYQIRS
jgi:ubiquitin-activating enzyme E1